jgi:hypothetical protein
MRPKKKLKNFFGDFPTFGHFCRKCEGGQTSPQPCESLDSGAALEFQYMPKTRECEELDK